MLFRSLAADAASGNAFASFLLGYAANGSVPINPSFAYQHLYYGAFLQDDWRVSRKLTLNLGLRWDYESPTSERFNQLNAGFDQTTASPFQVSGLQLKGGLLFVDKDNRLPYERDLNNFGPRVGVAYQLDNKTVLRGGYGLSYLPAFDPGTSLGYSVSTTFVASTDGNLKPANTLSNPYPTALVQPIGSSQGLATLVGQGFTFYDTSVKIPANHQFSFGIQREIPWSMVVDISYIGSRTRSLSTSKGINEISAADQARGAAYLNELVPNPFDEIGRGISRIHLACELKRICASLAGLRVSDRAVLAHQLDHRVAALNRTLGMPLWIVSLRCFGKRGKRSCFRDVEIAHRLSEVPL